MEFYHSDYHCGDGESDKSSRGVRSVEVQTPPPGSSYAGSQNISLFASFERSILQFPKQNSNTDCVVDFEITKKVRD
ncbi:hypothetical protein RUM43_013769 [Polyplax serrata]|uniref:Uncharacterized protein n=1 Tax=Polyplax serrata TaxID=468196 RepID=A0AAN8S3N6_POLSC